MFITFEGPDGVGKTTQVSILAENLSKRGYKVLSTREPGGSIPSEKIRNILITQSMSPNSELLLYTAARREHCISEIIPAIESNKIVICDRFIDSTLAYQGFAMGVPLDLIMHLHKTFIPVSVQTPSITFILDANINSAINRASSQKYEKMGNDFYHKVVAGFHSIAQENPSRCKLIDSNLSIEQVSKNIDHILNYSLPPVTEA